MHLKLYVLPLFLLNRLLSEGHILHVFLESVEWGVWFHTYTIVMILGVPSARKKKIHMIREKDRREEMVRLSADHIWTTDNNKRGPGKHSAIRRKILNL